MKRRLEAWQRLAKELDRGKLGAMITDIGLADALAKAPDVIAGKVRGRLVVDVNR
jgi:acrylyl-CoA reductase (NADPH)